jgi:hypothetical protein
MSLLDLYCRFERLGNTRSKARLDLVARTQEYEPLQKQGKAWVYLSVVPEHIRANQQRKSELGITGSDGKYISGVFIPSIQRPNIGYGDIKGTTDAALFLIDENSLEILIAKGRKNTVFALYQLLADGELDGEIEALRKHAGEVSGNRLKLAIGAR